MILALLPCLALAVPNPGLTLVTHLHSVDSSDAALGQFETLLAAQASLAPALVSRVSATNLPPTADELAPANCARVSVSGLPGTNHQAALVGHYVRRTGLVSSHAAYESSSGKFLYFNEASDGRTMWVAGPVLGSDQAGLLVQSDSATPQQATGEWYELDEHGAWVGTAAGFAVTCDPVPTTVLTTHIAPAGCAGAQMKALKESMAGISTVLHRNGFVLDLRAAGLMATSLDYKSHAIRDCAPMIQLTNPWAGKVSQPLAVSKCHYDGHKMVVDHASPGKTGVHHDSFACSHKLDKIAQKWNCECRTWKGDGTAAGV